MGEVRGLAAFAGYELLQQGNHQFHRPFLLHYDFAVAEHAGGDGRVRPLPDVHR